mmetsp:Transcript_12433/g.18562  ORF Transcript_12433/g.18562 Transcript_12433/m.18562 type:complete len:229 (+) Transcript_12433:31-717(+)
MAGQALRASMAANAFLALVLVSQVALKSSKGGLSRSVMARSQATPKIMPRRATLMAGLSLCGSVASGVARAGTGRKFPPIDSDPNRCDNALTGNTIGQANAVSDKELDLRLCALDKKNLAGKTLSGGLFQGGSFNDVDFTEAVMSKAYAAKASFKNCDFSNSVLDRVVFDGSDLTGSKFTNAVITGATFDDTILTDTTFEDAVIGQQDLKRLCKNPTLPPEVAAELGC